MTILIGLFATHKIIADFDFIDTKSARERQSGDFCLQSFEEFQQLS